MATDGFGEGFQGDFRGFHYDIARGAYLKPEVFCAALRRAAELNYTHFMPYLENLLRLPSMEKACPASAYTRDDWRQFDAAAKEAGIELVPHFNVIGHTADICAAYPELAGESGGTELDVELDAVRQWMLRCLAELCECSEGEHFLIGGDEWQPPHHLLARPGFDPGVAWANHINAAVAFLRERGRRPIVWHDLLLHYPTALPLLSREATIAFWFYDPDESYPALSMFKEMGFKVLMASGCCHGTLERRRYEAVQTAVSEAQRREADGFVMTTWSDGRWEKQQFNLAAVAGMIDGAEQPTVIIDALTRLINLRRLPTDSALSQRWRAELAAMLDDPAWEPFADLRRVVRAQATGDVADDVASYLRYQQPEGPLYDEVRQGFEPRRSRVWTAEGAADAGPSNPFGLTVAEEDGWAGPVLRFTNGEEQFEMYPRIGATLQNWRRAGQVLIPRGIDALLSREERPLPGGYRSYTPAGGFRPIWAMGAHSNPCITWMHPYEWSVVTQTDGQVTVELSVELPHVSVRYRVTMVRGVSGFEFETIGVNRHEGWYGTWNFNLPICRSLSDVTDGAMIWDGGRQRTTIGEALGALWIETGSALTVEARGQAVRIEPMVEGVTGGYFADWNVEYVTPDLHGIGRRREAGETVTARWRISVV